MGEFGLEPWDNDGLSIIMAFVCQHIWVGAME